MNPRAENLYQLAEQDVRDFGAWVEAKFAEHGPLENWSKQAQESYTTNRTIITLTIRALSCGGDWRVRSEAYGKALHGKSCTTPDSEGFKATCFLISWESFAMGLDEGRVPTTDERLHALRPIADALLDGDDAFFEGLALAIRHKKTRLDAHLTKRLLEYVVACDAQPIHTAAEIKKLMAPRRGDYGHAMEMRDFRKKLRTLRVPFKPDARGTAARNYKSAQFP